ncbi:MAG: hypothetical protein ACR2PY_00425, partial [Salinispira sp.]
MITKEGIEILFPWQLTIYKEVKAQVKQEVQEETQEKMQEMRQEAQREMQEKRQEGIQEGRQEGARGMLSEGFSAEVIQRITGLSEDEIRTLQNGSGKNGSR